MITTIQHLENKCFQSHNENRCIVTCVKANLGSRILSCCHANFHSDDGTCALNESVTGSLLSFLFSAQVYNHTGIFGKLSAIHRERDVLYC